MTCLAITLPGACGKTEEGAGQPVQVDPAPAHQTMPPPIWFLQTRGGLECEWRRLQFEGPVETRGKSVAVFPARCDEAELAWSGDHALVWLRADGNELWKALEREGRGSEKVPRDRLFEVRFGSDPVERERPSGWAPYAVGFDDVPLLFETPDRGITDQVRVWALVDGAWVERGTWPLDRLEDLDAWKEQRGNAARKLRQLVDIEPLPAEEVEKLPDVPASDVRTAVAIADAIDAGRTAEHADGMVVDARPVAAPWWTFDAGGVRMAIRGKSDRLLPDLRRFSDGVWGRQHAPLRTDSMRLEIWPAGVEVRGTWLLVTSDGRAGVLVNAKNNRSLWGNFDTGLSLFAPE